MLEAVSRGTNYCHKIVRYKKRLPRRNDYGSNMSSKTPCPHCGRLVARSYLYMHQQRFCAAFAANTYVPASIPQDISLPAEIAGVITEQQADTTGPSAARAPPRALLDQPIEIMGKRLRKRKADNSSEAGNTGQKARQNKGNPNLQSSHSDDDDDDTASQVSRLGELCAGVEDAQHDITNRPSAEDDFPLNDVDSWHDCPDRDEHLAQFEKALIQEAETQQNSCHTTFAATEDPVLPPLTEIDPEHERHLGIKVDIPNNLSQVAKLPRPYLSMLKLTNHCDKHGVPRTFLDSLLDLLQEEILENNFDLGSRPKRHTVCETVKRIYGKSREPEVVPVGVTRDQNHPGNVQRGRGKKSRDNPLPREINNRETDSILLVKFCARSAISDLLRMRLAFSKLSNLVINEQDPFLPYEGPPLQRDEILDGTWYRDTVRRYQARPDFNPHKHFILPLVGYADKTGTDAYQRYALEPFIFTLAIFRRHLRNHPAFWRLLAYLPEVDPGSKATKEKSNRRTPGASAKKLHCSLRIVFSVLGELEKDGMLEWIEMGDKAMYMRVFPIFAFIMGDGKNKDSLVLRKASYKSCGRISAACKTSSADSNDVTKTCSYLSHNEISRRMDRIQQFETEIPQLHQDWLTAKERKKRAPRSYRTKMVRGQRVPLDAVQQQRKEEKENAAEQVAECARRLKDAKNGIKMLRLEIRKELTAHEVENGLEAAGITFGGDPRGIYGATPTDLMHAFQSGIIPYLVRLVIDGLTGGEKDQLDWLVRDLFGGLRSGERSSYPKLTFTKFSNLTLLTSDEWPGMLFVLLIVLRTDHGQEIFKDVFRINGDLGTGETRDHGLRYSTIEELIQRLLSDAQQNSERHKILTSQAGCGSDDEVNVGEVSDPAPDNCDDSVLSGLHCDDQEEEEEDEVEDAPEDDEQLAYKCSFNDFIALAETLLCFHAWYKADKPISNWNKPHFDAAMRRMLSMVNLYLPRKTGNGWKLQKVHDLLHLAEDTDRFGSARNFDAGIGESHLRPFAKLYALTALKKGYVSFLKSVAKRAEEFEAVQKAMLDNNLLPSLLQKLGSAEENTCGKETVEPALSGSQFYVYRDRATEMKGCSAAAARRIGACHLHPLVEEHLRHPPEAEEGEEEPAIHPDQYYCKESRTNVDRWTVYTECTVNTNDGPMLFRCHPNYQNDGEYYDWAMVDYQDRDNRRQTAPAQYGYHRGLFPAKILAFVRQGQGAHQKIRAIIHTCEYRSEEEEVHLDTVIMSCWKTEYVKGDLFRNPNGEPLLNHLNREVHRKVPKLRTIGVENIAHRCFVIEEFKRLQDDEMKRQEHPDYNSIILLKKRAMWADEFF